MMNCSTAKEQMDAYLDDFLNEDEKSAFLEHLEGCPSCQQELAELRLMLGTLHDMGEDEKTPPEELKNSVIRILKVQQTPQKVTPFWRPLVGVAAAALIVVALYSSGILQNGGGFLLAKKSVANTAQRSAADYSTSTDSTTHYYDGNTTNQESTTSETIVKGNTSPTAQSNNQSTATQSTTQDKSAYGAASTLQSSIPKAYRFIATLDLTNTGSSIPQADLQGFPFVTTENKTKEYLLTEAQLNTLKTKYPQINVVNSGTNIVPDLTYGRLDITE